MAKSSRKPYQSVLTRKGQGDWNLDSLLDSSGRGSLTMWRTGVVVPIIIALVGLVPLVTGEVSFSGRVRPGIHLVGTDARVMGLAWIAAAAFVHFQFFWCGHKELAKRQGVAKALAFAVFVGAIGYLLYQQIGMAI